jgi:predicted Rossmann-fold nucleotide-binding protein
MPGDALPTTGARWDREAQRVEALLPHGPRLVVIGSTDFWHAESERTCMEVGRLLAALPALVLITGGVEGVGETIGRSFFQARRTARQEPRVYHVLPEGEEAWDYGDTFFAGSDMAQRREVLGRLAKLYVAVEGGP